MLRVLVPCEVLGITSEGVREFPIYQIIMITMIMVMMILSLPDNKTGGGSMRGRAANRLRTG